MAEFDIVAGLRWSIAIAIALTACTNTADDSAAFEHVFDACTPLAITARGATDAQRTSIARASQLWAAVGVIGVGDPDAITPGVIISFEPSTPSSFGFYDDSSSTILIDESLADEERAIVIAHELGHAFGSIHVQPGERASVMNPGNLTVVPTVTDRDVVDAHWNCANR